MTDDLVAFLRARLDDTARKALAAADGGSGSWFVRGGLEVCRTEPIDLPGMQPYHRAVVAGAAPAQLHHIAEHDPARVLAEVDAKRHLVDAYAEAWQTCAELANGGLIAADVEEFKHHDSIVQALKPHVLHLALPFREHPGYKPEWAPET